MLCTVTFLLQRANFSSAIFKSVVTPYTWYSEVIPLVFHTEKKFSKRYIPGPISRNRTNSLQLSVCSIEWLVNCPLCQDRWGSIVAMPSFIRYLLSAYCVPGTVPRADKTAVNQTGNSPGLPGTDILVGAARRWVKFIAHRKDLCCGERPRVGAGRE